MAWPWSLRVLTAIPAFAILGWMVVAPGTRFLGYYAAALSFPLVIIHIYLRILFGYVVTERSKFFSSWQR